MSKRKLYAVLAGINEYQSPVTPLQGCMHDVESWREYLDTESSSFQLNVQILQNNEVTKSALVSSLQNALTQASATDVVFFFYSGHGTREFLDPIFATIEQDNALESLVCYDSIVDNGGNVIYNLLSDKELHYIISQYGKEGTHIIIVFDCCHSGGMTRNGLSEKDGACLERRYVPGQRESFILPMRTWDKYLFGNLISKEDVTHTGWLKLVPQLPHVTLSACQNDESAYEQSGHGIFTSNLIDVLRRSNGSLSYYDLQSRTRLFTQNQFRQTPEIYTIRNHEDDLLRIFLDKTTPASSLGCALYYKTNTGWVIDLGAIHGITTYSGPVEIQVNQKNYSLPILEVFPYYSRVELPAGLESLLIPEQAYTANVKNHFSGNTQFFIESNQDEIDFAAILKLQVEKWVLNQGSPFSITGIRNQSAYVIRKASDKILICQNDNYTRPATSVSVNDPDVIARTIQFMRHIAQWEYIRSWCNSQFNGNEYPVRMNFYLILSDLTRQELTTKGDILELKYLRSSSGEWTGKLKVSITNQSRTKYYCSLLYLSNLFQVYGKMLDDKVVGLSGGETTWVYNGDDIELDLESHIIDFNYEYSVFYLKLLACIDPFQVETLEQGPLPAPSLRQHKGDDTAISRGVKTRSERAENNINWFTRTVCFKVHNPLYSSLLSKK